VTTLNLEPMVECLKAVAEPSRLRILRLLSGNDLTVSDLTSILGQSQPRVSRHLKLLMEARLIHRWQEGSWALFRTSLDGPSGALVSAILGSVDASDETFARDQERLSAVKVARRERASEYFSAQAENWDAIRSLHVPDRLVEEALLQATGSGPYNSMLDIGTGTGRMLELFAPFSRQAIGLDANRDMLNVARANLDAAGIDHAEVRFGDIYNLPFGKNQFDLIIIHQVLHFLDEPVAAIAEAIRALAPSGLLVVVDFAPHDQEFLRDQHQHMRLGFDNETVATWFTNADVEQMTPIAVRSEEGAHDSAPLTVMLWPVRDTRMLIAEQNTPTLKQELA